MVMTWMWINGLIVGEGVYQLESTEPNFIHILHPRPPPLSPPSSNRTSTPLITALPPTTHHPPQSVVHLEGDGGVVSAKWVTRAARRVVLVWSPPSQGRRSMTSWTSSRMRWMVAEVAVWADKRSWWPRPRSFGPAVALIAGEIVVVGFGGGLLGG